MRWPNAHRSGRRNWPPWSGAETLRLAQQRRTRLRNVAFARWKERCSRPEPAEAASCGLARAVYAPRPAGSPVAAADGQPTATKERVGTLARVCAATSDFPLGSSTLHRGRCVSGVRRGLARFTARPCINRPSPPARNSRPRSTGASATVALRLPGNASILTIALLKPGKPGKCFPPRFGPSPSPAARVSSWRELRRDASAAQLKPNFFPSKLVFALVAPRWIR
ncbi:uncharacterized protein Tco025E_08144 [Trypanosoma conorhini]|uniref:Uncharacterized protein n=1 Tax=Trypanosoma conorhini TaxID=83891 RepID=A0A422NH70_9TRYP|nr:uncharacterized protein Tco025E_08144 [Trypanosoma conorhini]RNF04801.1 hypothetical protein Tco025E_08144 [Trypanosoma conorhini]